MLYCGTLQKAIFKIIMTQNKPQLEVQAGDVSQKDGKIFIPLKNKWLIATPEEKVRQEFIKIMVNTYGYSLDQMA